MNWRPAVVVLVVAALGALPACGGDGGGGRDDLAADTARFSYGGRTATVALAECARDGDVVLLAGAEGGLVVQAAADVGEGGTDRSGVTGDMGDDGLWGAFGAEAGAGPGPAGEIATVEVEGDRVTVEGRWARLGDDLRPDPSQPDVEGRLVARCPEVGSEVS